MITIKVFEVLTDPFFEKQFLFCMNAEIFILHYLMKNVSFFFRVVTLTKIRELNYFAVIQKGISVK